MKFHQMSELCKLSKRIKELEDVCNIYNDSNRHLGSTAVYSYLLPIKLKIRELTETLSNLVEELGE